MVCVVEKLCAVSTPGIVFVTRAVVLDVYSSTLFKLISTFFKQFMESWHYVGEVIVGTNYNVSTHLSPN